MQIILDSIPAELISKRAVECKAYSRALFHLEQHIRQVEAHAMGGGERERLLQRLQEIYTQIDEPDGLEGISAHLKVLDINQQILSHRKAGRWAEAQTWYEIKLAENPENVDIQIDLLTCLKESGQHGMRRYPLAIHYWHPLTSVLRCPLKLCRRHREAYSHHNHQPNSTLRSGSFMGHGKVADDAKIHV